MPLPIGGTQFNKCRDVKQNQINYRKFEPRTAEKKVPKRSGECSKTLCSALVHLACVLTVPEHMLVCAIILLVVLGDFLLTIHIAADLLKRLVVTDVGPVSHFECTQAALTHITFRAVQCRC